MPNNNYRRVSIKSELCKIRRRCAKDAMGQCVSKKAAKALGQHRANMRKHQMFYESPELEEKIVPSKQGASVCNTNSRGISTSTFGFKKRNNNIISGGGAIVSANSSAAKRLANSNKTADNDPNGNNELVDEDQRAPLTCNAVPSGRTTPRIPPPKKEPNATKQVSRFGFRQPPGSRYKVADINDYSRPTYMDNEIASSYDNRKIQGTGALDSNRNRGASADNGKFMLQATQLPKPVPVRIMDSKTAKTLANNNRKISGMNPSSDESSKDGSSYLTEDSGIGSVRYEKLNGSPKFGSSYRPRRTFNMVVTGNKFDVLDSDLPNNVPLRPSTSGCTTGTTRFVHKRAMEYERNLERDHRKISVTSSEVSTSDYADEEYVPTKTMFLKPNVTPKWFTKSKQTPDDSSPPTSDDQMWMNGGEAMAVAEAADDYKCGFSSSDESKDHVDSFNRKEKERNKNKKSSSIVAATFDNLLTASKTHTIHKYDIKQVLLTIEDPSYAAVAEVSARQYNSLLSEEPSPDDSLFNTLSISEKDNTLLNRTLTATSPIVLVENTPLNEDKPLLYNENKPSDEANDKQNINSCPGTPTNGSNSLSLSEGRDFLIDDEIADQPALLIDDNTITNNTTSETATTSMASEMTLVDATPKSRRKASTGGWMESPLLSRRKQSSRLRSRAGSLDTLSPCESIESDDFMMDYSISSGIDDVNDTKSERNSGAFLNDDWTLRPADISKNDLRDWSALLSGGSVKSLTSASTRPSPGAANVTPHRLLRSRANTPNNTPQATRCSLDTLQYTPRSTARPQHLPRSSLVASSTSSSVHNSHTSLHLLRSTGGGTRSSSSSMTGGYDSDESATSLRLERSVQSGMIQDAMALKTMLFRLKRVLQESETHNPFDPASLSLMTLQNMYNNSISVPVTSSTTVAITNGHVFGNTCLNNNGIIHNNSTLTSSAITAPDQQQHQINLSSIVEEQRLELADLRRQVLYQQGQLEDRDKEVQQLREDMARLMCVYQNGSCNTGINFEENGGVVVDRSNAATQTDRIRPISCGPAILDATATGNGSLVSSTEVSSSTPNNSMTSRSGSRPLLPVTPRNTHHHISCNNDNTPISRSSSRPPLRQGSSKLSAPLCGSSSPAVITPVMPVVASSIPRRSCSRSRT